MRALMAFVELVDVDLDRDIVSHLTQKYVLEEVEIARPTA
jgi:hypothetical protein